MGLPKFAITTIVTFLLVVILNGDFRFLAQLPAARWGINWQFLLQSQVLAQTPDELEARADELLQQGIHQYQSSQFEAALQSWQEALIIYQKINDRQGEGAALVNLGAAYLSLGDYTKAIEYQQQSLAIAREINDQSGEGAALVNLGLAYHSLGDYTTAIEYHQQSLAIAREIKDRHGEGLVLGNLGIAYNAQGDYAKAIDYYHQSLAIAREIKNRQGEGKSLGNLGIAYHDLGDYTKAIDYQQQHLAIAREIKNRRDEGMALNELGMTYDALGNYAKAIEYLQQSLAITRELKDSRGEAISLGNLGNAYNSLGDYAKAIEYQRQSLAIAREIKDRRGEGSSLGSLGNVYDSLGDYPKAIEYQEQSLDIAREIKDRSGEGAALGGLGNAYYSLGDYSKAIEYQQQDLAIAREIKDRLGEGHALANLGVAYDSLEDYPKAIEYYQQSLAIAREIKDLDGEGKVLNNLGRTLYESGNLTLAEQTLLDGIKVWESIRANLGNNDANKVSIFEEQARTYRTLQQVLVAQNKTDTALEISERGRSRAFVELLASRLSLNPNEPVTITPPTIAQLKQTAKTHNATLVEYSIIGDEFKLQDKQKFKESELYIWVIKPTGEVTFRKADLKPLWQKQETSLADLVYSSRQAMGVRGRAAGIEIVLKPGKSQEERLNQLYQILIEPIADLLPTDPNAHVIFLPQSSLFLVPFPALQDANGKSLIEQHTMLTAPAIQVLDLTHQQGTGNRTADVRMGKALIVGNPTMPQNLTTPIGEEIQLISLPGAEKEAKEIAELFKTTPLIGNQATKNTVVERMKDARIIHLSTHGLLDDFKGLGIPGAIVLAPSANDNGLLTANEIFDLKLNAELVVLSACDTGRGRVTGDGVIGLSRSLISAGVSSVVVSLWSVSDDSTAFLMTEFYQNLQQKIDKAQALRLAMLKTREKYDNPLYWAAFTLIGES